MTSDSFYDRTISFVPEVPLETDGHTALMIVDMQYHCAAPDRGFSAALERRRPGSTAYYQQRLANTTIPSIQRLLTVFRDQGLPVLHVVMGSHFEDYRDLNPRLRRHMRAMESAAGLGPVLWSGGSDYQIIEPLSPQPDEAVLHKFGWGAFASGDTTRFCEINEINNLVLTGVTTNACVESTARGAADLGLGVVLVSDATADYDEGSQDAVENCFHYNFGSVTQSPDDVIKRISPIGGSAAARADLYKSWTPSAGRAVK